MMDGSVIVLFADGSVCSSPATVTPATPKPNASIESAQAATPAVNPNASEDNVDSSQERSGPEWFLINSRGERYHKTLNSEEVKINDIHLSYAVCPTSSQVSPAIAVFFIFVHRSRSKIKICVWMYGISYNNW